MSKVYLSCLLPESFAEEEVKPLIKEEHECVCEGSSCVPGNRCMGHQCFSSLTVSAGSLVYQKGCFKVYEQSTLTCKTPPSSDQIVECCHGHLCNLNSTVELPVKGTVLHTILYILYTTQSTSQAQLESCFLYLSIKDAHICSIY